MSTRRFEVQTLTVSGWQSMWTVDDEPMVFATEAEAQAELTEHLCSLKAAGMDASEHRIVPVTTSDK